MIGVVLKIGIALIALIALVVVFGPRAPVDREISFNSAMIGGDIDAYLAEEESQYSDITPGVEKQVIWAGARGEKTPLSIVYLHGFSATSQETRPLSDDLAKALGANLFYTRLTGHGRGGEAMAQATAGDWIEDVAEAMAIGRRIGNEVLVVGVSTGGTLAAIAATDPALSEKMKGVVLISPNFAVNNPAAFLLNLPYARKWVPLLVGKERVFEPENEDHATYWTTRYPVTALMPMAALVAHARGLDYSAVKVPGLFILSDADQVVRADVSRKIAARWGASGAPVIAVTPGPGDDPSAHVIAGDILSPGLTPQVRDAVLEWLTQH